MSSPTDFERIEDRMDAEFLIQVWVPMPGLVIVSVMKGEYNNRYCCYCYYYKHLYEVIVQVPGPGNADHLCSANKISKQQVD